MFAVLLWALECTVFCTESRGTHAQAGKKEQVLLGPGRLTAHGLVQARMPRVCVGTPTRYSLHDLATCPRDEFTGQQCGNVDLIGHAI